MYHRNKKLGLILGGGTLTETLINSCKKKKKNRNLYNCHPRKL